MTPPPEPRPPTILGEYGEGYCRFCHFVVALDRFGLLITHKRGVGSLLTEPCKGSGKRPPKVTPVTSRKAMFRTDPPRVRCELCGQDAVVTPLGAFGRHWHGPARLCENTGRRPPAPPGRNHSGERG